jgi:N-acetylglucosaminyl-diphospho-decaprenol L-rhamnosyltransferase
LVSAASLPLLSIVVVAYRSRDEIGACLGSLPRELGGRAVEVVVVDNSLDADGTRAVTRAAYPGVDYVVPDANLGFGRANNLGYARTTGECVLFLNPDTVCDTAALEHCLARVRTEPVVGLLSPKLVMADGQMDLACRRSIPTLWDGFCRASGLAARFPRSAWAAGYNLTHLDPGGTHEVGAINGAFMLGRREVFDAVAEKKAELGLGVPGGRAQIFDERFFMYGDDLDLCIRVERAGWRIVYDGRVAITHIKGTSVAKNHAAMSAAIFDANREVYLKHFNPRGSRFVAWKWRAAFGAWKLVSRFRARLRGYRQVKPL